MFNNFTISNVFCRTAHNEYLQGFFEMGIAFPVLVIGYFISIYRRFVDKFGFINRDAILPVAAIIIIAVNSAFNFAFHIAPTAMVAILWMAILQIKLRPQEVLSGSDIER